MHGHYSTVLSATDKRFLVPGRIFNDREGSMRFGQGGVSRLDLNQLVLALKSRRSI